MSVAFVSSASTVPPVIAKSTPSILARSAAGLSTSSRDSSDTKSIAGCLNTSRSAGISKSSTPSTSSFSIASSTCSPTSWALAAPPALLPAICVAANVAAPPTANTVTTAAMSTPLRRLDGGPEVVSNGGVFGGGPAGTVIDGGLVRAGSLELATTGSFGGR